MAIKRCPYCKAIIDERAQYCTNCGTQLLFPEDESIEEEIPGEKILDEEEEKEEEPEEKESVVEEEKEEKEELSPSEEETEKKAPPKRVKLPDTTEEREKEEIERFLSSLKKEREEKAQAFKESIPSTAEKIPEKKPEELTPKEPAPEVKKEKTLDFKTEELDKIPDAKTKEREEIERFLSSLRVEKVKKAPAPPAEGPLLFPEKELKKEVPEKMPEEVVTGEILRSESKAEEEMGLKLKETGELAGEQKKKEGTMDLEEKLPPWAERMRKEDTPSFADMDERKAEGILVQEEALGEEEEQAEEEEPAEEEEEEEGIEFYNTAEQISLPYREAEEEREVTKRVPSRLSIWIKSRAFDFLSMAFLWIISLLIASRLVKVSFFKLIIASALPALGFYLTLLVIYFSFFIILLGETPGDLIFSKEK